MKPFTTAAVIVFLVVAIVQLVRVIEGWDITIDGFHVPMWASVVACALAMLLAVTVWRENRRRT
jgi:hypothetical protein